MFARVHITIVDNPQDAREHSNLRPNEKVIERDRRNLLLLEEDASVLHVEHFDGLEDGEIEHAIRPNDVSLLIVPFDLKGVLLFAQNLCHTLPILMMMDV